MQVYVTQNVANRIEGNAEDYGVLRRTTSVYWKKRVTWLLNREDRVIKILVAASGLFIGLMLGHIFIH